MLEEKDKLLPELVRNLACDGDIQVVYLFGSHARGEERPLSDIDLALLLKPAHARHYFAKKMTLLGTITSLLKTDKVDLVILNQAPPVLRYHVLREGKALFVRDENVLRDFRERTILEYLDLRPLLEVHYKALTDRIKEGGFGE